MTGAAIMVHAIAPTELTTHAVAVPLILGGVANLFTGIKQINNGIRARDHCNWKQISDGIVSIGLAAFTFQKPISQALNFIRNVLSGRRSCLIDENLAKSVESMQGQCDLSQSKVIFLSDKHDDEGQNLARQKFLNSVMKEGDILLLEGLTFSENVEKGIAKDACFIKPDIEVRGWESGELYAEAQKNSFVLEN
jgi:hypothetical protein